ncbi:MAG: hypothetical protein WA366_12280 [Pseudolabrys sp.]
MTNFANVSRRPSVLIIEDDALVAEMIAEMVSACVPISERLIDSKW